MEDKIPIEDSFIYKINGLKWHNAGRIWFYLWIIFGFSFVFIENITDALEPGLWVILFYLLAFGLWGFGGFYFWKFLHSIPKCPKCKSPISWRWANYADMEPAPPSWDPKLRRECPSCNWEPGKVDPK